MDNALQNYLHLNNGSCPKVVIEYYAYILDFIIPKMLCVITCMYILQ